MFYETTGLRLMSRILMRWDEHGCKEKSRTEEECEES